jgi:hypothetical protein
VAFSEVSAPFAQQCLKLKSSGIHAMFVWLCVNSVLKTSSYKVVRSQVLIALIFVFFVMGTINFISHWAMTQQDYVDNRLYPGGPIAYSADHYNRAASKMSNAAYVVANFFADSTMVSSHIPHLLLLLQAIMCLETPSLALSNFHRLEQKLPAHCSSLFTISGINE